LYRSDALERRGGALLLEGMEKDLAKGLQQSVLELFYRSLLSIVIEVVVGFLVA
jgi:hypothetical protein